MWHQTRTANTHTHSPERTRTGLDDLFDQLRLLLLLLGILLVKAAENDTGKYVFCTLHIGLGTFNPIRCSNINDHKLHEELLNIPRKTIEEIESCRNRGGKVIAVGTTVLRALESF